MKSDIIFLSETHSSNKDMLFYDGYKCFSNCRSESSSKKRGGLAVFIRRHILNGVSLVDKSQSELMWFKLSSTFFGLSRDLYICFVYIAPYNSTYVKKAGLDKVVFSKLEDDIIKFNMKGDVMIMGDLNAHINSSDHDFILNDSDVILDSVLPNNYISDSYQLLRNTEVPQTTNSYGKNILDLCISGELRLLNGRTIGDTIGKATYYNYQGVTINDYCLCSGTFMNNVINFQVGEFMPCMSDHCPITVKIFSRFQSSSTESSLRPKPVRTKWSPLVEDQFVADLQKSNFKHLSDKVSSCYSKVKCNKCVSVDSDFILEVNDLVEGFSDIIKTAAVRSGGGVRIRRHRKKVKKKINKTWHDDECNVQLRHVKNLARVLTKSPWDKSLRLKVLYEKKKYHKLLRRKCRNFKAKLLNAMLDTSEKNPLEFWRLVNSLKDNREDPSNSITPQDWLSYFKELMNKSYTNSFNEDEECKFSHCNNDLLNVDITVEEVKKAVKSLKNNKACSIDCITNEMIKASCTVLLPLYVTIFNLVLKSGIYPNIWRENFIKPIFKGGNVNDPSCYRGIAISSCLSKLFTGVLFNRLDFYLETNNIMCSEQIGFRKHMRTSDHILTLKTLIDKYFRKNKYIFACFIDLKKAFDTINREALLYKLSHYNISGDFFSILKSMYSNVSFSVNLADGLTNTFESSIGVKQGCILSPTLFSLYVNDLSGHFNAECEPLDLNGRHLSCLLYADDVVLMSESSKGLQNALNILKDYCEKWNLEVNIEKTKVIIFNKSGKILKNFSFSYGDKVIQLTNEYKYLGIIFKASGTFSDAIIHLSKKASKAAFCIWKSLYSDKCNVLVHLKLFDSCVKPILLYCSELWALPLLLKGTNLSDFEVNYEKFVPDKIQVKFAKYLLGVHKSATNIAVLGELGLYPLSVSALKSCVSYWLHVLKATDDKLIFHAYKDNVLLKNSLFDKLRSFFHIINFGHLWENQTTFSKKRTLNSISRKLQDRYNNFWYSLLFNDNKVSGTNKLRTYREFKNNFKREQFLFADVDKQNLRNFIKIRISNCNLNIERGRYMKLPVDQRICQLCNIGVEDEYHFLLDCNKLSHERSILFSNICDIVPSFKNMSRSEQVSFLLSSHDLDICKINILGVSNMYQVNQALKQKL